MADLTDARRFQDLLGENDPQSPYDYAMLFAGEGFCARWRAKRRFKLLKKIDTRLRPMLNPGEQVYFVTTGTTVSLAEAFFVGWIAHMLNFRAILFTTERIILLEINSRHRPRKLLSQIRYSDIARVTSTWNGICQISLRNKRKLKFQRVPRAERKFLHHFLRDIVKPTPLLPGERINAPEHLCPACFKAVEGHPSACPHCGQAFKSANAAGGLSMLFPGLGDLYLGHRTFALLEMAGGGFLWLVLIGVPLLDGGYVDPETGETSALAISYWVSTGIMLLIAHLIDAVMTRHFGLKGHYPK
jgi:hypothetical protein